eukprot:6509889-Prymnesium_polylepis.1
MALFGARHGVGTGMDGENGELSNEKTGSLVVWGGAPKSATSGERRVAADVEAAFERSLAASVHC